MKKIIFILLVTCFFAVGCNSELGPNIYIGVEGDPVALNSNMEAGSEAELTLLNLLGEGLYSLDESGELIPALAKGPVHYQGAKTIEVEVRDDLLLSDGTNFDVQRVYQGLQRALNSGGKYSYQTNYIKEISLDGSKIRMSFEKPFMEIKEILALPIFYPQTGEGDILSNPSIGPFKVEQNDGDELVLVRNSSYWNNEKIQTERVYINYEKETKDLIEDYDENKYDIVILKDKELLDGEELEVPVVRLLWMNTQKTYLADVEMRNSFVNALDKKLLIKTAELDERIASGIYPDSIRAEKQADIAQSSAADVEKIQYRLIALDDEKSVKISEEINRQFEEKLGVTILVENLPEVEFLDRLDNMHFDFALESWEAEFKSYESFAELYRNPLRNKLNPSGLIDEELDKQFKLLDSETEKQSREQIYREIENRVMQLSPSINISQGKKVEFFIQRLKDYTYNPIYNYYDLRGVRY